MKRAENAFPERKYTLSPLSGWTTKEAKARTLMTRVGIIYYYFFFSDPPDHKGGHDVVERVELRLAAQYKRVFDVGESLQNLEKGIHVSEQTYSLLIFCVLGSVVKYYLSKINVVHFSLPALQHSSHAGFLFWQRCTSNRLYLEDEA